MIATAEWKSLCRSVSYMVSSRTLWSVSICCISPSGVSLVRAVLVSPPALHKNTQSDLYCSIHVNTGLKVKVHTRSLTLLSGDIWEAPHGVAMELDWSEVIKTDTAWLWGCMIRVWGLDLRIYPVQDLVTKGGTVKSVTSGGVSAPGLLIYEWIQLQQPQHEAQRAGGCLTGPELYHRDWRIIRILFP